MKIRWGKSVASWLPNNLYTLHIHVCEISECMPCSYIRWVIFFIDSIYLYITRHSSRWPFCWMINENVSFGNLYFFFWNCRRSRKLSTKSIQRIKHIKSGWKMKNSMQLLNMQYFGIPALFKFLSTIILLIFFISFTWKNTLN